MDMSTQSRSTDWIRCFRCYWFIFRFFFFAFELAKSTLCKWTAITNGPKFDLRVFGYSLRVWSDFFFLPTSWSWANDFLAHIFLLRQILYQSVLGRIGRLPTKSTDAHRIGNVHTFFLSLLLGILACMHAVWSAVQECTLHGLYMCTMHCTHTHKNSSIWSMVTIYLYE